METGNLSHIAPTIWSADYLLDMENPNHQQTFGIAASSHQQAEQLPSGMSNLRKRKRTNPAKPKRAGTVTRERNWTDAETSALLKFVNTEFRPQRRTRSRKWELIVEAIHRELGANSAITVKRCMQRMNTLTGEWYYKLVTSTWERMEREKDNPTEDDLRKLIESCGLTVDWYEAIKHYKAIQGPGKGQGRPRMQMHSNIDRNSIPDGPNRPSSSSVPTVSHPVEPVQPTSPQNAEKLITNPIFRGAEHVAYAAPCYIDLDSIPDGPNRPSSSRVPTVSDPLEPVQPTSPQNAEKLITNPIAERFKSLKDSQRSTLLDLIFGAEVWESNLLPRVCQWLSIVQKRRDHLAIYEDVIALEKMGLVSWEYDGADISGLRVDFESLRAYKKFFKEVMERNSAYDTCRRIQDEAMVKFDAWRAPSGVMMLQLFKCKELEVVDLSGFRKLRWLSIWECLNLREMIGWECLEELGCLEIYQCPSYDGYPPLQKIPSLQEVSLWPGRTSSHVRPGGELDVSGCVRLRGLKIFCDWALSSIRGLEGLGSLTVLALYVCNALRNLLDIGHMKDLTHLTIIGSAVEEIKGVEKLSSLEELNCLYSKLKTLPDLGHLPHLRRVVVHSCPVVKDPSSPYYKRNDVEYKRGD